MAPDVEQLYQQALCLPDESKASVAERLVAYLQAHIDRELEPEHLEIVERRRERFLSGQAAPVDGREVQRMACGELEP